MKRLTCLAMGVALTLVIGCGKDKKAAPAKTETAAAQPAAGSAGTAPTAAPGAAGLAAAGQAVDLANKATAAAGQAADLANQAAAAAQAGDLAAAGQAAAAAGQAAAAAGQVAAAGALLTDAQIEALGGRLVGAMEGMTKAVEATGGDCAKMGTALEALVAQHQPLIDELHGLEANGGNEAKFQAWTEKNIDKVKTLAERMATLAEKCADDARVSSAFSKLME